MRRLRILVPKHFLYSTREGRGAVLGGYVGRMLWVDLTARTIKEEPVDENMARDFVGGYGLAARITYDRMPANVDPLGPENILGLATGPLTGTLAMQSGRFVVTCKSPLTNTWGDANGGGKFGPGLKAAGFDAVFFIGQSDEPLYLHIKGGHAELKSASHLWGKDSNETEAMLRAELGKDTQVACIGQAGETLSLIAAVMNEDGRAAARSGVGAVMGSKRLKAVAVQGNLKVPVVDAEGLKAVRRTFMERRGPYHDFFTSTGTIGGLSYSVVGGDSPIKNWAGSAGDFPQVLESFDPDRVMQYQSKKYGCWQCTVACGGHMEVAEGPYQVKTHKPEYETGAAFGNMCLNPNFESIVLCNDLCNRYGFDTISAGAVIAFAMECYENGLLTQADTGGIELTWGNHEAIVAVLKLMGERSGIGDLLADGVKRAAEKIGKGAEQFAIHIQGQELPMHDPKLMPSLLVSYLLDATPGRHTQGYPPHGLDRDLPGKENQAGHGDLIRRIKASVHLIQSSGLCTLGPMAYDAHYVLEALTAVTGEAWDVARLDQAGERIENMRHAFNLREGLNPLTWAIPDRVVGRPPQAAGPNQGFTVDVNTWVADYLAAMDWDAKTARPSAARLRTLGLNDLVEAVGR